MKDLATQAYFSYLHEMISKHEELQTQKSKLIEILEIENNSLRTQLKALQQRIEAKKNKQKTAEH